MRYIKLFFIVLAGLFAGLVLGRFLFQVLFAGLSLELMDLRYYGWLFLFLIIFCASVGSIVYTLSMISGMRSRKDYGVSGIDALDNRQKSHFSVHRYFSITDVLMGLSLTFFGLYQVLEIAVLLPPGNLPIGWQQYTIALSISVLGIWILIDHIVMRSAVRGIN